MPSHAGSCLCQQVRWTMDEDPVAMAVCHCHPCRKTASASASNNLLIPTDKFKMSGDTKKFVRKGMSTLSSQRIHFMSLTYFSYHPLSNR